MLKSINFNGMKTVKSPKWKHQRNRKNEDNYLEQYWNEDKGLIITELPAGQVYERRSVVGGDA